MADRREDLVLVAKDGGDQPSDVRIDSQILHRAMAADDEHYVEVRRVDPAQNVAALERRLLRGDVRLMGLDGSRVVPIEGKRQAQRIHHWCPTLWRRDRDLKPGIGKRLV